jgi:hypothetical protein
MSTKDFIPYLNVRELSLFNFNGDGGRMFDGELYSATGKMVSRLPEEDEHYLYLMFNVDCGQYKIGETRNLFKRRLTIKVPTCYLVLIDFCIIDEYTCQQLERQIIKCYNDLRISGDWFYFNDGAIDDIGLLFNSYSSDCIRAIK